jgi:pimeloyl-ACP methyl ester carboxylesterase
MNIKTFLLALWFGLLFACFGHAAFAADSVVTIPAVSLRPGVVTDIGVTVRTNPRHERCVGRTIAAVHGVAHTAATWNPLVDELFSPSHSAVVCRVALIDLPGHGQSALPSGSTFGELLVDDYVTAVIGTLDGLAARKIRPHAIVGHSMGGLVVEAVQARLLSQGTSLVERYGISFAALLSPVPAREHPWAFAESGQAAQVIGQFVTVDPLEGTILRVDPGSWDFLFFTNFAQEFSPGTPSPASVVANGYISDEPFFGAAQLVGLAPFDRVSAGDASFAPNHGTRLLLVNPSQDLFNIRAEMQIAYVQLTGDDSLSGFLEVDDRFAVHDMHVAQPKFYLQKVGQALLSNL